MNILMQVNINIGVIFAKLFILNGYIVESKIKNVKDAKLFFKCSVQELYRDPISRKVSKDWEN